MIHVIDDSRCCRGGVEFDPAGGESRLQRGAGKEGREERGGGGRRGKSITDMWANISFIIFYYCNANVKQPLKLLEEVKCAVLIVEGASILGFTYD